MNDTTETGPTATKLPLKKERRTLEAILTREEREAHSQSLANTIQALARMEDKKKWVVKEIDAEIAALKAEMNAESDKVKNGTEFRDILCEWQLDSPAKGKKQLVRTDAAFVGNGVVATYDMSGEDTQSVITFEKGGEL